MSKNVERFRAGEFVEVPIPDPQGKWVRWSDYEKLQSKLAQVEQELAEEKRLRSELKQIAQTGISEVSSVGTALKEIAVTDLRISVVELCKQRASEYDQYARGYAPGDRMRLCLSAKRDALNTFATELEKL